VHAGERLAERKHILRAYGANIIYTDPADGSDGALSKARELYAAEPEKYFYADQYSNDAIGVLIIWALPMKFGTNRGPHHAFRSHAWHQRDFCWNCPAAEGVEPANSLHFSSARFCLSRD